MPDEKWPDQEPGRKQHSKNDGIAPSYHGEYAQQDAGHQHHDPHQEFLHFGQFGSHEPNVRSRRFARHENPTRRLEGPMARPRKTSRKWCRNKVAAILVILIASFAIAQPDALTLSARFQGPLAIRVLVVETLVATLSQFMVLFFLRIPFNYLRSIQPSHLG